jgi:hypothetical protein
MFRFPLTLSALSLNLSLSLSLCLSLSRSRSACLQITLKNSGLFGDGAVAAAKRKSDFIQNRKLSTKPAEIVAETFCHLFTIEGHHIAELKKFYRCVPFLANLLSLCFSAHG